ncbi:MAG: hypothetical protein AB8B55_06160 [Mariniblastus sp.]
MNDYPVKNLILGLVGAAIGGVLAYFLTDYARQQGLIALVLPGAGVGLGFGLAARHRHFSFAVIGGVLAVIAGLFTHWKAFYKEGVTLVEYFDQLGQETPLIWLMLACGVWLGYSWSYGRPKRYRAETSA